MNRAFLFLQIFFESKLRKATHHIQDAAQGWIKTAQKNGIEIPDPAKEMSGKLLVRLPKSLHKNIARRAELEGVSINTFIVTTLTLIDRQ